MIVHLFEIYLLGSSLIFPPCCQFYFPDFYGFLDKVYDLTWYFVRFEEVYYPALWEHIIGFFEVNPGHR